MCSACPEMTKCYLGGRFVPKAAIVWPPEDALIAVKERIKHYKLLPYWGPFISRLLQPAFYKQPPAFIARDCTNFLCFFFLIRRTLPAGTIRKPENICVHYEQHNENGHFLDSICIVLNRQTTLGTKQSCGLQFVMSRDVTFVLGARCSFTILTGKSACPSSC